MKRNLLFGLALLAIVAAVIGFGPPLVAQTTTTFGVPSTSGNRYEYLQYQDNAGNVKGTSTISAGSLTLNQTSTVTRISHFSMTVTPTAVAANRCEDQSVSIASLTTDDVLMVNPAALSQGANVYSGTVSFIAGRVSTSGVAAFRYCNMVATTQTPTPGTFTGFVIRKS